MSWRTLEQLTEIAGDRRTNYLYHHRLTGLDGFEDEIEYNRRFKRWIFQMNDQKYNELLNEKNYYNNLAEKLEEEVSNRVLQGIPAGDLYRKMHGFFDLRYKAETRLKIHELKLELEYLSGLEDEENFGVIK